MYVCIAFCFYNIDRYSVNFNIWIHCYTPAGIVGFNDQSVDSPVGCLGVLTSAHFPKETPWCCWGFAPETRKRANYKAKKTCSIISHRWLLSLAAWANIYACTLCHTPGSPTHSCFWEAQKMLRFGHFEKWWVTERKHGKISGTNRNSFLIQVDCDIMSVCAHLSGTWD